MPINGIYTIFEMGNPPALLVGKKSSSKKGNIQFAVPGILKNRGISLWRLM
jgi:hypothetical protein